jgi:hypothetical protein
MFFANRLIVENFTEKISSKLVKHLKRFALAMCLFVIPLIECVCCEQEVEIISCCDQETSNGTSPDLHPCLELFDDFSLFESFQFSTTSFSTLFDPSFLVNQKNLTARTFSASPPYLERARRHLILRIIII